MRPPAEPDPLRPARVDARHVEDVRLAKALSHPLRVHALGIMRSRPATATEVARELGEPPRKLAYHFGVMERLGVIELVERRPGPRGSLEHVYRAVERALRDQETYAETDPSVRDEFTRLIIDQAAADAHRALESGAFHRDDPVWTHEAVILDDVAWREAYKVLTAARERILELQADALGRIHAGEQGGAAERASLTIHLYEAPASS